MPCCGLRRRYDAAGVASWMLSDSWLAASRVLIRRAANADSFENITSSFCAAREGQHATGQHDFVAQPGPCSEARNDLSMKPSIVA